MRELNEILIDVQECSEDYRTLKLKNVSEQSEILRRLSCALQDLEFYRADLYDDWLDIYFSCKATSNASKTKLADNQLRELHRIRMVMRGGHKLQDSMRSTISVNRNL